MMGVREWLYVYEYNVSNVSVDWAQADSIFISNERYTHSQVSIWIHSDRQKKLRSTKEKMARPTTTTTDHNGVAYTLFLLLLMMAILKG
jgi:hypothetical protein